MAAGDILATRWFSPMPPWLGIGVVAAEGGAADWAAYIGCYSMLDDDEDETARNIAKRGAKLDEQMALAMLPELAERVIDLGYRRG